MSGKDIGCSGCLHSNKEVTDAPCCECALLYSGMSQVHYEEIGDPVSHPKHYTKHPSGVECIQISEHMGFCLGNAVKYIWRADLKNNAIEDLEKAAWYLEIELAKRKKEGSR